MICRRRIITGLALCLLLAGVGTARDITVGPDGAVATLKAAIALAHDGDRIIVQPGVYHEGTIEVFKSIEIIGVDRPVFDGDGSQAFTVTADNVTIRGLVIRNVTTSFVEDRAGIKIDDVRGCSIEDNRLEDTFFGIYLAKSANCQILGNQIIGAAYRESQSGNGIHLWYSRDIVIEDNVVSGHRDGIYFEFVEDALIQRNVSTGNVRYGLHFMFSDRCTYVQNRFQQNGAGVAVMYTENVQMTDNIFEDNWGGSSYGLLLKDITDSHIVSNVFRGNSTGLYAEGINRVRVESNDFEENGWAVRIMANSMDNTFSNNNFTGNTFDVATNSRNNFSTFHANYWDNYRGFDLDRDGFGDVPFRPVRLFSQIVQQNEPALMLLRSFFVSILDFTERIIPIMTPDTLVDSKPVMNRIQ
jgi:nitrous oxidase accessory protein